MNLKINQQSLLGPTWSPRRAQEDRRGPQRPNSGDVRSILNRILTDFGAIWERFGTDLGPISDRFVTTFLTNSKKAFHDLESM